MVKIADIAPGGIAESLALLPGDRIVAVDATPAHDFLDVMLAEKAEDVTLFIEREDGELWELEIEKEAGEPFGFVLEHPEPKSCGNNCVFCFVHQLPKGMRRTLYIKDEDYRFSYLYGSYITLSNVTEDDLTRIVEQKLSPLYISVHTVDDELRAKMLGRELPSIMPLLERLVDADIELHTQIVVCPGVNDGEALEQSVLGLARFYPGIKSLALVPVGLTRHRDGLAALRPVSAADATDVLDRLDQWQHDMLGKVGSRFVFAADEFYLKAEREFPALATYEQLSQLENGVGMIPCFRSDATEVIAEAAGLSCPVNFSLITGWSFELELSRFLSELEDATGCRARLYAIENSLFGDSVTVAGLVSGGDIVGQLKGQELGDALLVPDVMLRSGEQLFLDDMTIEMLGKSLSCRVMVVDSSPWGILDAVEMLVDDDRL